MLIITECSFTNRSKARSPSSPARPAARGGGSRWSSARRGRPSTSRAARPATRRRSTRARRRSRRPRSSSPRPAGPGSPCRRTIWSTAGQGAVRPHPRRPRPARRAGQRHLGRRAAVRVGQARLGPRPRQRAADAAARGSTRT